MEMVSGEYPYSECKNAAQIYKKVTQGMKPDCLARIDDQDVYDLICSCIGTEKERPSAKQIMEHPFLAMEPEVILVSTEGNTHLVIQVISKFHEHLSVKFDFNGKSLYDFS